MYLPLEADVTAAPTTNLDLGQIADRVSDPSPDLVSALAETDGDIVVLGAAGKMGVSLSKMASGALDKLATGRQVFAVSRFSDEGSRRELEDVGVRTIRLDLGADGASLALPDAANVVYMVGRKFGTSDNSSATWHSNVVLPSLMMDRYRGSRVVAFSSGNVYPYTRPVAGGATEATPPDPRGDYAQSCLGREQVLTHYSHVHGTPLALIRLNYAVDCRYGVLTDIARAVLAGQPIDLTPGAVNVVWQGDANRYALSSLSVATSPPMALNVTGPELASVRWIAEELGKRLDREPILTGQEADTALLSNAALCHTLFGYPEISLGTMLDWTCQWLVEGGHLLDKPTGFGNRDGRY
jgi:nucleoside-diphosphate-sugar epimerase